MPEKGTQKNSADDFNVVLVGSDTGIYALARTFHQTYGLHSQVVARAAFGPVSHSDILTVHSIGLDVTTDTYIDYLLEHAQELCQPGKQTILLCNTDHLVEAMINRHEELEKYYFMPILTPDSYKKISDKTAFNDLCNSLDIPTPLTVSLRFIPDSSCPALEAIESGLTFPVIAKPSLSADYEKVTFEGQKKVFQLHSQTEIDALISKLYKAGFTGEFVFQQKVLGDDTAMRSITAYVDASGKVTLFSSARVLLEDHAPGLIGVPLAMVTESYPELYSQAEKLLQAVEYRGFANFDVKVDSASGISYFLEVNPRLGRNGYYATASGGNIAKAVVDDLRGITPEKAAGVNRRILYSLVPKGLLVKYLDKSDRTLVKELVKNKLSVHPLRYHLEKQFKRRFYVFASTYKQILKFRKYYPVRSEEAI
ncbi:carboxylate--amine ligase [Actinomycetaceae bacterium TAE3-ERU4]|nr:carboxylate--amine ligase [Actinomycetaceae bacterium TAE3-ERU4]